MKNELKKGAIIGYINLIATFLVAVIYTPIMLKLMGQSEYGLYSLVVSVISYLSVMDMGFGNAMIRYVSKYQALKKEDSEKKINGLFLIIYTIIGLIALIIGVILVININRLFGNTLSITELNKSRIIMIILLITVALSFPLSVFDSYAMASEKFVFLRVLSVLKTISVPLIMLPLLFFGYKSIAMVIVTSLLNLLFHFITMYYCVIKLKMKFSLKIKKEEKKIFKEIAVYSFFIFLNLIVDTIFNNTDQIILGSICGTVAVSVYAVAIKITQLNTMLSTTISGMFLPKITKTLEEIDGDKKVSDIFISVSRIQLYIMSLILFGFVLCGKNFIYLWAGKEYLDSYYIIILLIGPAIIPLTQNICISIIQAKNKHQFRSVVYIIIAIINVIISIPLSLKYGAIGASIGTALSTLLGQIIIMNIFYYKVIKIDIPKYWKHFFSFVLPLFIIVFLFSIIYNKILIINWLVLILEICAFTFVYLIYCIFYLNTDEKKYIFSVLKKLKGGKK